MTKKSIFENNIEKFRRKPVSNRYEDALYDNAGIIISYDKIDLVEYRISKQGNKLEAEIYSSGNDNCCNLFDEQAYNFLTGYRAYLDHKQRQL